MVQVIQSPLLQALGYAILNSLWQFGLLWLAYLLINSIFNLSPHKKYTAATVLQLAGFTWFCGTLLFYYQQCVSVYQTGQFTLDAFNGFGALHYTGTIGNAFLIALVRIEQFLPYLSVAYLLLLFFLSAKWIVSYRYTAKLKHSATGKLNYNYRLFVVKICHQLGIKRLVKVYLSDSIQCPLTIGYFKPIILIPLASLNHLSQEQMEAVLLHELAHIKRFDYLVNLVLSIIEVILFFNPFMQLLSRHVKRERENSCDDWVLQYDYNAATYARALLQLATFSKTDANFAMKALDPNHTLLMRVKRMIEKKDRSFNYRNQLVALLVLSAALSSFAWIAPSKQLAAATTSAKNVQERILVEPLVATIENPLFNPVFFLIREKPGASAIASSTREKATGEKMLFQKLEIRKQSTVRKETLAPVLLPALPEGFMVPANESVDNAVSNLRKWKIDTLINNTGTFFRINNKQVLLNEELKKLHTQFGRVTLLKIEADKVSLKKELSNAFAALTIAAKASSKERAEVEKLASKAAMKAKEAQAYYEVLFNKSELKKMGEELESQLEKVYYQPATAGIFEGNGFRITTDHPATIIRSAPNVQPAHTYSFDYNEKPAPTTGTSADYPATTEALQQRDEANHVFGIEEINPPSAPKVPATHIRIKKVLKIVRI